MGWINLKEIINDNNSGSNLCTGTGKSSEKKKKTHPHISDPKRNNNALKSEEKNKPKEEEKGDQMNKEKKEEDKAKGNQSKNKEEKENKKSSKRKSNKEEDEDEEEDKDEEEEGEEEDEDEDEEEDDEEEINAKKKKKRKKEDKGDTDSSITEITSTTNSTASKESKQSQSQQGEKSSSRIKSKGSNDDVTNPSKPGETKQKTADSAPESVVKVDKKNVSKQKKEKPSGIPKSESNKSFTKSPESKESCASQPSPSAKPKHTKKHPQKDKDHCSDEKTKKSSKSASATVSDEKLDSEKSESSVEDSEELYCEPCKVDSSIDNTESTPSSLSSLRFLESDLRSHEKSPSQNHQGLLLDIDFERHGNDIIVKSVKPRSMKGTQKIAMETKINIEHCVCECHPTSEGGKQTVCECPCFCHTGDKRIVKPSNSKNSKDKSNTIVVAESSVKTKSHKKPDKTHTHDSLKKRNKSTTEKPHIPKSLPTKQPEKKPHYFNIFPACDHTKRLLREKTPLKQPLYCILPYKDILKTTNEFETIRPSWPVTNRETDFSHVFSTVLTSPNFPAQKEEASKMETERVSSKHDYKVLLTTLESFCNKLIKNDREVKKLHRKVDYLLAKGNAPVHGE